MVKKFLALCALALASAASIYSASPFAGFYVGQMYTSISGNVSMPERPLGPVAFTISSSGVITSTGDLTGTVSDSGAISWNANSTGFTTGQVANGVISANTSVNNAGTISHFRIDARNSGPGVTGGNVLGNRLQQANPTKALRDMHRVRFVGDHFVAVGNGGAFARSYDGLNWTRIGVPTTLALYDVAYGNGTYVVVGDSGARFWSTNGLDWVASPAGTLPVSGVAFGNGIFVSSSSLGGLSSSTDGIAWTSLPGGRFTSFSGVDFLNGEFVAWSAGTVAFSANAQDWSAKGGNTGVGNIIVSPETHHKIAHGNGVYVVGGQQGLAYSADGNTWTAATKPSGAAFANISAVGFGNGRFVVSDASNDLWVSTNGSTWRRIDKVRARSIDYGLSRFVAVGDRFWTSRDGEVWIYPEVDQLAQNNREQGYVDPLSEGKIVGTFFEGSATRYSFGRNGHIEWFAHGNAGGSGVAPKLTSETLRFATSARLFESPVIVGNNGSMVVATESLGNVTFKLLPPVTTSDLVYGARSSDRLVFVGTGGRIVASADASRTNFTVVNSGVTANLKHVAYYNQQNTTLPSQFIAVGENGVLLTSVNGTTWTPRTLGVTLELVGSAYNRGSNKFQVATAEGRLFESADGATWTETVPLPAPHRLRFFRNSSPYLADFGIIAGGDYGLEINLLPASPDDLNPSRFTQGGSIRSQIAGTAHGNGRTVAVGGRMVGASVDGQTWMRNSSDYLLTAVAFGNRLFVAVSIEGKILVSDDGLRWRLAPNVPANTRSFGTVVFGDGRFVAAGNTGLVMVSQDGLNWTDKSLPGHSSHYEASAYGSGTFVLGGGTHNTGAILVSKDGGANWTSQNSSVYDITGLAYGNGVFTAVGQGSDGWTATSPDGLVWTTKQYPFINPVEARPRFTALSFADGSFYAPSGGGALYISTDGANWTRNFTGIGRHLRGGARANGQIVFASENEIHLLSVRDEGSPIITQQPLDATVNEDGTLALNAAVAGDDVEIFWLRNGVRVPASARVTGGNSATLQISPLSLDEAGEYELIVANRHGSRSSRPARVTVRPKPIITAQPRSAVGTLGQSTSFSATATGSGLSYRWFRNGTAITGATSPTLTIDSVAAGDAGEYHVEITNAIGTRASEGATLSVVAVSDGYGVDPNFPHPSLEFTPNSIFTFQIQPDGKVILSGVFTVKNAAGQIVRNLVRLNANGTLDETFVADVPNNIVRDIQVLANGKILLGGYFNLVGLNAKPFLALSDSTGKVEVDYMALVTGIGSFVQTITPRADGKYWAGGSFPNIGGRNNVRYLAVLNSDGTVDTSFTPPTIPRFVYAVHQNSDGSLILGGGDGNGAMLIKVRANNTIDTAYPVGRALFGGTGSTPNVTQFLPGPNGTTYMAGEFREYQVVARGGLARLLPSGELDASFAPRIDQSSFAAYSVAPFGEHLLVGGMYGIIGGSQYLVLLDHNGNEVKSPKLPTFNSTVRHVQVAADNSIVVSGDFSQINGQPKNRFARLIAGGGAAMPLEILLHPQSQTVRAGARAGLTVAARGAGTLTFQWLKNGQAIAGQTGPALEIEEFSAAQAGAYTVQVRDASGTIVSQSATLALEQSVAASPFEQWAATFNLPEGRRGMTDDPDNDGYSNAAEYAFGTDPALSNSKPALQHRTVTSGNVTYPAVSYVRNKNAAGVSIEITASTNVTFAAPATVVQEGPAEDLGSGLERVTVRSTSGMPTISTFFFKVRTAGN